MSQQQNWELSRLQDYLLYDTWDVEPALRLLAGFNYIEGPGQLRGMSYYPGLDPSIEVNMIEGDKFEYAFLKELEDCAIRLKNFWLRSNNKREKYPPSFFIEWALSKRSRPPWLDWAIEHGLYVPEQEAIKKKIETTNIYTIYSTKWLEVQQAAIEEFFSPRHEVDAKKEEVIQWIEMKAKELKIRDPNRIATSIFTIIKPEDHSPRKRRVAPQ